MLEADDCAAFGADELGDDVSEVAGSGTDVEDAGSGAGRGGQDGGEEVLDC